MVTSSLTPVRLLLTQRAERADMPLHRAVGALSSCQAYGGELWLALVSHPRWQATRAPGGASNWSLTLTGPGAGARAWTERRAAYGRPRMWSGSADRLQPVGRLAALQVLANQPDHEIAVAQGHELHQQVGDRGDGVGQRFPGAIWHPALPCAEILPDLAAEMAAMRARVAKLERRLSLNSSNSGKPPSSDGSKKPARVSSLAADPEAGLVHMLDRRRCHVYAFNIAAAHLVVRRFEQAIEWADRALHDRPRMVGAMRANAHLGHLDEARVELSRILTVDPELTIAGLYEYLHYAALEVRELVVTGFRLAGLPDE